MDATVERIAGTVAELRAGDDGEIALSLPLRYLPAGVREGDRLRVDFSDAADQREEREVAAMRQRLAEHGVREDIED